jgi:alkyl sulfatase BDS1-like metallo-beta-lactamase superfamily hydrolase
MTTPTKTFFDDLAQRGHVPWLEAEHGRLRLELVDEDCVQLWTVAFDHGDVRVDRDDSDADAVVRIDRAWFDRAVTGEEKLMPAVLRGEISLDGSYGLVVQLSRLLPGPSGQSGPTKARHLRGRSA